MVDEAKMAGSYVKWQIMRLCESSNESAVRAKLAKLRRGISKPPGSMPDLWEMTLAQLPESMVGKADAPSRGEWAVYIPLTLFALHQQSKDINIQCMHKDGVSLGAAAGSLIDSEDKMMRIKRRFDAAATSDSLEEFFHHLRGLIQLFKAEDKPLDYSALAEDIYRFQSVTQRDSVRLSWGRDFYRHLKNSSNETQSD
jgi:CRISPR system Cascade subunit CasB